MARFTAEGLGYSEACKLIDSLKQSGIEANITAGGVAIHATPDQVDRAREICREAGAIFSAGYSMHQEEVMLRGSGWDVVEQVTNDAIAILKEWEENNA